MGVQRKSIYLCIFVDTANLFWVLGVVLFEEFLAFTGFVHERIDVLVVLLLG